MPPGAGPGTRDPILATLPTPHQDLAGGGVSLDRIRSKHVPGAIEDLSNRRSLVRCPMTENRAIDVHQEGHSQPLYATGANRPAPP